MVQYSVWCTMIYKYLRKWDLNGLEISFKRIDNKENALSELCFFWNEIFVQFVSLKRSTCRCSLYWIDDMLHFVAVTFVYNFRWDSVNCCLKGLSSTSVIVSSLLIAMKEQTSVWWIWNRKSMTADLCSH